MSAPLYDDPLAVGQIFGTGKVAVEAEAITAYAADFDPQPFHLDEAAANSSLFGGLVASGWHTAALSMRLLVGGKLCLVGGLIGLESTNSDGFARFALATYFGSNPRCWACAPPSRSPSGESSGYEIRH